MAWYARPVQPVATVSGLMVRLASGDGRVAAELAAGSVAEPGRLWWANRGKPNIRRRRPWRATVANTYQSNRGKPNIRCGRPWRATYTFQKLVQLILL